MNAVVHISAAIGLRAVKPGIIYRVPRARQAGIAERAEEVFTRQALIRAEVAGRVARRVAKNGNLGSSCA